MRTMNSAIAGRQPLFVMSPDKEGAIAAPRRKPPAMPAEPRHLSDRSFGEPANSREHDDDDNDEIDPTHWTG